MSHPARKPCDQCTRRKVRCNYETPCNRCVDTGLSCTHSIVRKKRGPRKGKGVILDSLRTTSQGSEISASPLSPTFQRSEGGSAPYDESHHDAVDAALGFSSAPATTTQQTAPTSIAQEPLHAASLDLDNFISFDEFTQHVLADSNYFPYETGSNQLETQSVLGETPHLPAITPLGSGTYETPQTALATTGPFPDVSEQFEVTPVVERSVDLFFEHIYPIYPLLTREVVTRWLQNPQLLSRSEETLIWSICATTLAIVDSWPNLGFEQRAVSARRFIRRCHQRRIEWDYMEEPCFEDILTSLFIANAFFDLKCRKASWMHVREAISLAVAAGLHDDSTYSNLAEETQLRLRRTYALLYITERGAAIQDGFPVSILIPPKLQDKALAHEDPTLIRGLAALHSLFSLLDFKFVKLWNDPGNATFASSSYSDLFLLQSHLRDLRIDSTGLSDVQRADILITHQWLRLIFWQASLRQGYISTAADDAAFTYNYPIEIAMELCAVVKSLAPVAIQAHGLGIFEKQFEIAYSLMDALALSGTTQPEHHDCLRYLLLSLSTSPNSRQIYVRTLEQKMGGQQKYRSLAGFELLRDDGGSRQNSRRQSRATTVIEKRQ